VLLIRRHAHKHLPLRAGKRLMLSLVLLAAGGADLPSFPCGPTNSPTEAVICGDPELAAYDRAMAVAYRRMPAAARARQRAWLAERNQCSDTPKVKVCIRLKYTERLLTAGGIFGTTERPKQASVPTYLRDPKGGPGVLSLLDVGGGKFVYHLSATFLSETYPGHPEEISGDTFGVIQMENGVGREVATHECDFTLRGQSDGWLISDAGACLGMNNNPDGLYLPRRG
jgi:hypothetical protein